MPLPFFDRRHRPKLPLPQLAKTLSDTLRGAIAEDPQKIDLLAHAFHCRPDEVRQHPRLLAILQKSRHSFWHGLIHKLPWPMLTRPPSGYVHCMIKTECRRQSFLPS